MYYRIIFQQFCFLSIFFIALTGCAGKYTPSENMANLNVQFADTLWNGVKVPDNQQCNKFGGNAETPSLKVSNIPLKANTLIVEYSDRDASHMDNGGHGKVGYTIPSNTPVVTIPSIKGHTFELPENFFVVSPHANPSWDKAGAYMPPCSGGRGNRYYATVKAVYEAPEGQQSELLGKGKIELGKY